MKGVVPLTRGLPFPRGMVDDPTAIRVFDGEDRPVPYQSRVLHRWPDGSVRWLLLDWQAESDMYRVRLKGPAASARSTVTLTQIPGGIEVDTGPVHFRVQDKGSFPFAAFRPDGTPLLAASGLIVEDAQGRHCPFRITQVWLEEGGPVRSKVALTGELHTSTGQLRITAEFDFYAGMGAVRAAITLTNPRPATHPGGTWDLGSGGSVHLRDVSLLLTLATDVTPTIRLSPERGHAFLSPSGPIELYQDSSGGENWLSKNHIDRHRRIPLQFRGYRLREGSNERYGLRATPIVTLQCHNAFLGIALPCFWQNFPKAIEASGRELILRLFPRQSEGGHEIQGGEQKTHDFYLAFGQDTVAETPLDWCRDVVVPTLDPAWCAGTEALPYLSPRGWPAGEEYERLLESAVEGPNSFEQKREIIDEYGWRHFGDIYGDHEGVHYKGPPPVISHYNNQFDPAFGFGVQFLRTGDARWWHMMNELVQHVIDIDIYHTDGDKPLYNHGLFWHTAHYTDADTATHRTYPRRWTRGGGPSADHNYPTGLMLHYFLTGSRQSREAAIGLARRIIDMDDGERTLLRWLARGPTGWTSTIGSLELHGPGRSSGNSLVSLIDGHILTQDSAYLSKAEELIRRVIHPLDDVPARGLLDAENRWFYVMFLQAIGKYLQHKAELGQIDWMYSYGRACLLLYARWMAEHERPNLTHPERLHYPTETWAAQDLRKAEVLWFAWLHAEGDERERFRERARFFYWYSIRTLTEMPTRHYCRPVVLLLSHGFRQGWFEEHPDARLPAPPPGPMDFGKPVTFVAQKTRALRRAKVLACVALVITLVGFILARFFWMG